MKILFVVNNFNIGGPQKSLLNLLYDLEGKNVNIDLMILNQQDELSKYLPSYVNKISVPSKYALLMLDKNSLPINLIKNLKSPKLIFNTLLFIVKSKMKKYNNTKEKQKFWIDNKWNFTEFTKTYDYAIGFSGGHSIYFVHDYINADNKIGSIISDYKVFNRDNEIDKKYFEDMTAMLAVSNKCAEIFYELFDIQAEVFYNSLPIKLYENIDEKQFDYNPKNMNLCTICRLDEGKGLDLLIDAAKFIKKSKLNIKWYVVGKGKLENWLEQEIEKNQLNNIVIPLGFIFNTGSILKKMDLLIHPSRFEGKSNTIDEALFYNKIIVATNFDTVFEQINDGDNGFIVNMDGKEIAEKIIELYKNEDLYHDIKNKIINSSNSNIDKGKEFLDLLHKMGEH
ncbi:MULTISPECIES: glycosyltransferase [unclassified Staphylococcus]|uniref:glycosyltransferase n=1 Tax=unclassified Staphylococcus TaxID=91994 RepID=UPI001AEBB735|nr:MULTISPECIES: glycosyltransferase [unclassified Staphylococcus]